MLLNEDIKKMVKIGMSMQLLTFPEIIFCETVSFGVGYASERFYKNKNKKQRKKSHHSLKLSLGIFYWFGHFSFMMHVDMFVITSPSVNRHALKYKPREF